MAVAPFTRAATGAEATAPTARPAARPAAARTVASIQLARPPRRPESTKAGAAAGRRRERPADRSQPLAALRQPALDRADGEAQLRRGLLVAQPLEVAQDDRRPEPLGQPVELLVQLRRSSGDSLDPAVMAFISAPSLLDRPPPRRPAPSPSPRPSAPRRRASSPPTRPGGSSRLAGPGSGTSPARHPRRRGGCPGRGGRPPAPSARAAPPAPRTPMPSRRRPDRPGSARAIRRRTATPIAPAPKTVPRCRDAADRCSLVVVILSSSPGSGFHAS